MIQLKTSPEMAINLLEKLSVLLRKATHKIENLAFLDVYGRVVTIFKELAKPHGKKFILQEKLTHQEIANMAGTSRETVSRILNELMADGYITVDNKQITIHKKIPLSF